MHQATIDELCFTLKCKTFSLENLDEQYDNRIQSRINQLKGVMNYHREKQRQKLKDDIKQLQSDINNALNNLTAEN